MSETTTDLFDMSREMVADRNGYKDATPAPYQQIAPAVGLLDQHRPDWWREVDLDHLVEVRGWDILGQLYGSGYRPGYDQLSIADDDHASELGFSVRRGQRQHANWMEHWAAWRHEILQRRRNAEFRARS